MRNKNSILVIFFVYTFVSFSACNSSKNPIPYSSIGTVESSNSIYLDFDTISIHTQQNILSDFQDGGSNFEVGDRVVAYYHILDNTSDNISVQLLNIHKIVTSPISFVTNDAIDTLYKDPVIKTERMWVTKDFLTVDFRYRVYDNDLHFFQLAQKASENTKLNPDTIKLNFRHDAGKDEKGSQMQNLLSFNLTALKPLGKDSVVLAIKSVIYKTDSTSTTETKYLIYK